MNVKDLLIYSAPGLIESAINETLAKLSDKEVSESYKKFRCYWLGRGLQLKLQFVDNLDTDGAERDFLAVHGDQDWVNFGPVSYSVDEHPDDGDGLHETWVPEPDNFRTYLRTEVKVAAISLAKAWA